MKRDLKFMEFSKTISNSTYEVIGVKTPILKVTFIIPSSINFIK